MLQRGLLLAYDTEGTATTNALTSSGDGNGPANARHMLVVLANARSAGKVRFGSGSGLVALNAEPEPCVQFRQSSNLEPEPAFRFSLAFKRVRTGSDFPRLGK